MSPDARGGPRGGPVDRGRPNGARGAAGLRLDRRRGDPRRPARRARGGCRPGGRARATRSTRLARSPGSPGGSAFELSEEFATWRAVASTDGWHVDVSGSAGRDRSRTDLRARDFTVNAIAVCRSAEGDPIDPTGGVADAEARRPARRVRGRLRARPAAAAARLPARVRASASTSSRGRRSSPAATPTAPPTRPASASSPSCGGIVAGPRPAARAPADGRARPDRRWSCPELEALRGVVQNPNHHLDVLGHTLGRARGVARHRGRPARFAGDLAAEVRGVPRRAARRRAHPAGRAALRRALPRHGQAGDP